MLRYLYADSEPFPLEYDFLATLRAAITAAAATYDHTTQIEALRKTIAERDENTQKVLGALSEFESAMTAAREAATGHFQDIPAVVAFSDEVRQQLDDGGVKAREGWAQKNEQENQGALDEIEEHRRAMREVLSDFVLHAELGLELTYGRMTLKDEGYDLRIGGWTQGAIEVDYGVSAESVPEWKEPRKIEDLAGDMILQVGMKKKFLRKDLTREFLDVSDYVLGSGLVYAGGCEAELQRKASKHKDAIVVKLTKAEGAASATVQRLSEESEPFPASEDELQKAEHLWQSLQDASLAALPKRDSVHGARLDGRDVFAEDLEAALFDRVLKLFTPIVQEIARRSPSAHELSLKLEHDDGRREEVYLKKEELAQPLLPLDETMRARFAPLGIVL